MKESNYNKTGKTGKKNFVLFAIFLLCITLLRSQIRSHRNLAFDSNPAMKRADNTQQEPMLFSSPADWRPPAGLQVDSNPSQSSVRVNEIPLQVAGRPAGQIPALPTNA